jgi:hypothetical protein
MPAFALLAGMTRQTTATAAKLLVRSQFKTERISRTLSKLKETQKRPPDTTSPTDEEHFLRPQLRPDFFGLSKNLGNAVCFEELLRIAPYPLRASPSRCIKHFPLLTLSCSQVP